MAYCTYGFLALLAGAARAFHDYFATISGFCSYCDRRSLIGSRKSFSAFTSARLTATSPTPPILYRRLNSSTSSLLGLKAS